jgi:hypothetical protein
VSITLPEAANVMKFLDRFERAVPNKDIYFVGTDDAGVAVGLTTTDLRGVLDYTFSLEETLRDLVDDRCPSHRFPEPTCSTCQALYLLERGQLIEHKEVPL